MVFGNQNSTCSVPKWRQILVITVSLETNMWHTDKSQEHCTGYRTKQQDILCTISQLVKCQCRYIRKKGNYVTCTWNGDSSVDDFENTRVKKIGGANQTSKGWLYFRRFDYYFRQRIGRESFLIFSNLLLWWEIVVLQIYFKFCIIKL